MHAFLVIGKNIQGEEVFKKISRKNNAQIIPFELQKIEDVRNLRNFVKLSFPQKTAVCIENIDTATPQAQNAFLKNLEEPQKNIIYILTAGNLQNVIPTIVSRCQIVKNLVKKETKSKRIIDGKVKKYADSKNIDTKFKIIDGMRDRNEAIEFVEQLIIFERENGDYEKMDVFLLTLKNLKANGNVSLQLTNMLVSS